MAVGEAQWKASPMPNIAQRQWTLGMERRDVQCPSIYPTTGGWHACCAEAAFKPRRRPESLVSTDQAAGCLVVSVGARTAWKFEDAMVHAGCDVVAVDPSLPLLANNMARAHAFTRSKASGRLRFLYADLRGTNATGGALPPDPAVSHGRSFSAPRLTLDAMIELLTEPHQSIHVLKMDCAGCEWEVLADVAARRPETLTRVRQLHLELHLLPRYGFTRHEQLQTLLRHLRHAHGFRIFHTTVGAGWRDGLNLTAEGMETMDAHGEAGRRGLPLGVAHEAAGTARLHLIRPEHLQQEQLQVLQRGAAERAAEQAVGGSNGDGSKADADADGRRCDARRPLTPPTIWPKVAVCLVGELRSAREAGPSIVTHLLAPARADAFVLATTKWPTSSVETSRVEAMLRAMYSPHVVQLVYGEDKRLPLLNASLVDEIAASPLFANHILQKLMPEAGWPKRYAWQLAQRHGCYRMVRRHEQRLGHAYDVYIRTRLDIMLFQPLPLAFYATAPRHRVIVPEGEDFGTLCSGLNDRFWAGGALAFHTDAHLWQALLRPLQQAPRALADVWTMETLQREESRRAQLVLTRPPLAYCIIMPDTGKCKYIGELIQSVMLLPELPRQQPRRCGDLGDAHDYQRFCRRRAAAFPLARKGPWSDAAFKTPLPVRMQLSHPSLCWIRRECQQRARGASIRMHRNALP